MSGIAERHRNTAAAFGALVDGVGDWAAPTPVAEWTARDVVAHLTDWLPGLLASAGVALPAGPSAADDPVAAWRHQARTVQALLDDPEQAGRQVPFGGGERPLEELLGEIYEPDVFMHSWDLARASGQDFHLDQERCAQLVEAMGEMEELIRSSGQFGVLVDVPAGAAAEDRLIGFIGRDPGWQPPGR